MGERAQQGAERDLALHPRQRGAEAVVDAEAEGEVAVGVAEEVEVVGVDEDRLVAVGGGEDGVDEGAGGEGGAGEGEWFAGVALRRGFEDAEHFGDDVHAMASLHRGQEIAGNRFDPIAQHLDETTKGVDFARATERWRLAGWLGGVSPLRLTANVSQAPRTGARRPRASRRDASAPSPAAFSRLRRVARLPRKCVYGAVTMICPDIAGWCIVQ
jgi:hypothetical protein